MSIGFSRGRCPTFKPLVLFVSHSFSLSLSFITAICPPFVRAVPVLQYCWLYFFSFNSCRFSNPWEQLQFIDITSILATSLLPPTLVCCTLSCMFFLLNAINCNSPTLFIPAAPQQILMSPVAVEKKHAPLTAFPPCPLTINFRLWAPALLL